MIVRCRTTHCLFHQFPLRYQADTECTTYNINTGTYMSKLDACTAKTSHVRHGTSNVRLATRVYSTLSRARCFAIIIIDITSQTVVRFRITALIEKVLI